MQLTTRRVYSSGTAPSNVSPASRTPVAQPARSSSRRRTASAGVGPDPVDTGMIDAMTKHMIRRLRANHGQEDGTPDRAA